MTVLHDLNLAAIYADKIAVLRHGRLRAFGAPAAVLDDALLIEVFDCPLRINATPAAATPFVLPHSARGL